METPLKPGHNVAVVTSDATGVILNLNAHALVLFGHAYKASQPTA
jgi:hypothetical protein